MLIYICFVHSYFLLPSFFLAFQALSYYVRRMEHIAIPFSAVRGARFLGPGAPVYMVAEISANHLGSVEHTENIIRAMANAGADAIKLQTYTPDTITLPVDTPDFCSQNPLRGGRTLHSIYQEGTMPWEWQPRLKALANSLGLDLFSTPFDPTAVDFLENMGVPCHKIASLELVDIPLLQKIGATGKPVLLSTGAATLGEIEEAVTTLEQAQAPLGIRHIVLLKCTSAYPAPPEEANLRTLPNMAQTFACPVGLSDHTVASAVALGAVALGACLVEKHVTLSRADGGLDAPFSLEPEEFAALVREVRTLEAALGSISYVRTPSEANSTRLRRSLYVAEPIAAGEIFTPANIRSVRPALGLHTRYYEEVLGKKARRPLHKGEALSWDALD